MEDGVVDDFKAVAVPEFAWSVWVNHVNLFTQASTWEIMVLDFWNVTVTLRRE
jgi:hypothetical protein